MTDPAVPVHGSGRQLHGISAGLLLGAVVITAAAAGFWGGFLLGAHARGPELLQVTQDLQAVRQERDLLAGELAGLKQDRVACELAQRIEQDRDRSVQERLKEAQDERLALAKEISALKRVIRLGGRGVAAVHELTLSGGERQREYRYQFTVRQLIEDAGETEGSVDIRLSGRQDGKDKTLALEQLKGSKPRRLDLRLERSQTFDGRLVLPVGFEPQAMTVEIKPQGDKCIASAETFPWRSGD